MVPSLKQKTVSGLLWSFTENIARSGLTFIIGIILARLLTPKEFGLIGMITIFITVSLSIINSGFTQALIQKKNATDLDFSTVFYFNLLVSVIFYALLYVSSPLISEFFNEPELNKIIKVLAFVLVVDGLAIIQTAKLIKRVDFKLQTKISVLSNILGGGIGVYMAFTGFGVWSLVVKQIAQRVFNTIFLWFWNKWIPAWAFSKESFKELFGFGSKLLIVGLIDATYRNAYILVIGKFFSASDLGYFTRADIFKRLPSSNITTVIQRVTFPVFSSIQDDIPRLRANYRKLLRATMFITFPLMIGMAAVAKPMIVTLIGEKWLPSVIYLQMLSFVGMFHPLHAINRNMLGVQGRSDLLLKLEIITKILAVPIILIGVFWGIKMMIAGMILDSIIAFFINSYWSGKMIHYASLQQLKDILPSFLLAGSMGILVYITGFVLQFQDWLTLTIQVIIGAVFIFGISELLKLSDYMAVKEIVREKLGR